MSTTQPKERPILFSGEMVRAIREGRKTQTRRIVKPQPEGHHWEAIKGYALDVSGPHLLDTGLLGVRFSHRIPQNKTGDGVQWATCKHGKPEDRLWVRETWAPLPGGPVTRENGVLYRADGHSENWLWRPSIHMPRWASRITLEIVAVRMERLNDITNEDCWAEGLPSDSDRGNRTWYSNLWESINGNGSWDLNPWVWAIEFKVCGTNGAN